MKWELRVSELTRRWIRRKKKFKLWITCFIFVLLFSTGMQELHYSYTRDRFHKGCQCTKQTFTVIYYWDSATFGLVGRTSSHTALKKIQDVGWLFRQIKADISSPLLWHKWFLSYLKWVLAQKTILLMLLNLLECLSWDNVNYIDWKLAMK